MSRIRSILLLIACCLFCNLVLAQYDIPPIPEVETSVYQYDDVNLLSEFEENSLKQKLIRYSDSTSTQIVVVVIRTTKGENIGLLTPKWAHEWGVGQGKEDNGVFILLARDDRKIWISPGYGVEDRLTAGITGTIVRNVIIPEFKRGDYYAGLDKGSDAIFEVLTGAYQSEPRAQSSQDFLPIIIFILLFFIFIVFIIAISKKRGGGKGGGGKKRKGMSILDAIILSNMGRGSYGRSSGGFGRSSGGSFGGGFSGGFGGGGFSGGGAGGSW